MLKLVPPRKQPRTATSAVGELALIERIRARAAKSPHKSIALGIGDDCAVLRPPRGHELVLTTDLSLEGRHFRRNWHTPASIGHRTLARGLSDIAAMGAQPLAAFLSLALPRSVARSSFLDGFLDGLLTLAHQHGISLAGGDTSESPTDHILADIVVLGSTPRGTALRRSGAQPGDLLYVTGALGGAATELATLANLTRKSPKSLSLVPCPLSLIPPSPHLYPQPRITTGAALRRHHLASACIDVSDGLSTDLNHLCTASHVAAEIDAATLPLHPLTATLTPAAALHNALHGGEDYELLFTASPRVRVPRSLGGVPITRIGRILPQRRGRATLTLIDTQHHRTPLAPGGWEHLQ